MQRRQFITLLGGAAAVWPLAARAQQRKSSRIGVLILGARMPMTTRLEALQKGLQELGYVAGQNMLMETRWAEGKYERLAELAVELIRWHPDVIVTHGTPGVRAVMQATSTIPIVMVSGDALATGLINSLARPGGNVTGLTFMSTELIPKRLEVIKEMLPSMTRASALLNRDNSISNPVFDAIERRATALAINVQRYDFRNSNDLDKVFTAMGEERVEALVTYDDIVVVSNADRIASYALKRKIALVAGYDMVKAGGLLSYAPNLPAMFHRAATLVDKVLQGDRAAELPVELPTRFSLTLNLRTAKALGLTISPYLLVRADEVIE
jgi:putative ABC transport system substrate-binding protein